MKQLIYSVVALFIVGSVNSQVRDCGSMEYLENQLQQDPKMENKMQAIENHAKQIAQSSFHAVNGVITIPVVVHVVYNTSAENISDAQIQSQMTVLNDDFRRNNADQNNIWSQAADTEIEFCLATVDPNGNSTNGITRTFTSSSSFSTNDNMKFNSSGGKDAWPASDYLNMWVCDISGSILGYAQFPGGSASTDGVVMDYQYFGTIGTATSPFDLGRTTTHEVGHWLNLRHIWGDGGCSVDDFVSDTPTSDNPNYGCATGHVSCGSTDMVQNYMDYSDDACMNLFTQGQTTRMRALFEPGGFRNSLLSSTACGTPSGATCTDGVQNGNETGVDCGGSCPPCPCTGTEVTVSITLDNYPEETSWTITNAGGSIVASGGTYGSQPDGSTVQITNCLADGCYDFNIFDSYGDGICCGYGNGSYTVTENGNVVASGGNFASSESTNFCVGGGPAPTCNDGIQNQGESGVDCGGPCPACPTCDDGIQNQGETGVDCGGPCSACPTCDDGIQNQGETGIDCGGPCAPCATCDDGVQNGNETGVDCGGSCPACPTCDDGIQNQGETGVDCGGPCAPCPCNGTDVTVSITFDNYPEETSWTITNAGGSVVASGGTYGSQPDGSTVQITNCLADGCYDFNIFDSYGDGICCSYGNGSYTVTENGNVVASGGAFTSSESTNFCLGAGPSPTCTDGIQNQGEAGIDCGGPCPACPTCDDGIQNQGETGVDCGGPCAPCATCNDGVQNGNETGVDCGGSCPACPTCNDGIQNQGETGVDCGGPCAPCATCNDGVQNGNETGVDCGGSCPACPTCSDGIQNQGEEGVDCGGPCAPCGGGGCTYELINFNNFDTWGIWNDGGSDCRRSANDAQYAWSASRCVRLRDNTSSSTTTTDNLNLTAYDEITVDFYFYAVSMETNEDFWLQVSTNGGSSYTTVASWASGSSFVNNQFYTASVVIDGPFTSNTRLRFRCDASANSDRIYLDDVSITGCYNGGARDGGEFVLNGSIEAPEESLNLNVYPNPTQDVLNVQFETELGQDVQIMVYDLQGRILIHNTVDSKNQLIQIDVSQFSNGTYLIQLLNDKGIRETKRFIVN